MEHEDRALFRAKVSEPALERVAVSDVPALVGDHRRRHRGKIDFDRPASTPADDVERGIHGEPMQPVVDAIWVAERREVAPRPDVGILDGVASELRVAQDQTGDRFEPADRRLDEVGEGVMIASPRSLHEFPLVHAHPR